jgi:hypothetical protein
MIFINPGWGEETCKQVGLTTQTNTHIFLAVFRDSDILMHDCYKVK